jgi:hypothetical protein
MEYGSKTQGTIILRNISMEYSEAYTVVEKLPSDAMGMEYGD